MKLFKILFFSLFILFISYYINQVVNHNPGVCPHNQEACYYTGGYYESRALFREKSKLIGAQQFQHQIKSDSNEDLTIDVSILNKPKSKQQETQPAIIHMSGTHGVEGYTGSAIQVAFLDKLIKNQIQIPKNITIVLVHAVNPFGFLHNRRWNENGVDLNRNFLVNDSFPGELDDLIKSGTKGTYRDLENVFNLPQLWNSPLDDVLFYIKSAYYILTKGFTSIKAAAVSGQYYNDKYIFYGGNETQPSVQFLTDYIRKEIPVPEKSIFIDVHSGLGPEGIDTLMGTQSGEYLYKQISEFFKEKYGDYEGHDFLLDMTMQVQTQKQRDHNKNINSQKIQSGAGEGYELTRGTSKNLAIISGHQKSLSLTQEFGTVGGVSVLKALIEESSYWAHNGNKQLKAIGSKKVKDVFFRDNIWYKTNTVNRGLKLIDAAIQILQNEQFTDKFPTYK